MRPQRIVQRCSTSFLLGRVLSEPRATSAEPSGLSAAGWIASPATASSTPPPMTNGRWLAEVDEDAEWPDVWCPRLHTRVGHTASLLNVWFESRETCESWIRAYVIGIEDVG